MLQREKKQSAISGGPPPKDVLVELRDVHKSFGDVHVLRGISLRVQEGRSAVILGGSGSGKSVLIKHIVQLLKPDSGEVWVMGQRADRLSGDPLDRLRLSIGFLFQGGALFDSMTVSEQLDFYLTRHTNLGRAERKERIEETLSWVNLTHTASQYPAELSGGQRKRIGLARAIILQPGILLYDEPTTGLDPVSVRAVANLIVRLRDERNITSMAITHDLLCAEIIADEVHFLAKGRFVASGSLEGIQESGDPAVREFFGLEPPRDSDVT
jgi:phospholipid/cholesterol/gamma-HCH transport system ATP-binding protein